MKTDDNRGEIEPVISSLLINKAQSEMYDAKGDTRKEADQCN